MITPLEQTLVGAGVGAAAATAGSILATWLIAPRAETALRKTRRVEEALDAVLVGLEHEIWPVCTRYLTLYRIIDPPIAPGRDLTIAADGALEELEVITSDLPAGVRRLSVFVSKVDDADYRTRYGAFLEQCLFARAAFTLMKNSRSGILWEPDRLLEPMRDLLRVTNRKLGHEFFDLQMGSQAGASDH